MSSSASPPRSPASSEPTLLLCDCEGTASIDGAALGALATGRACGVATALCTREQDQVTAAFASGGVVTIACRQEAETFADILDEDAAARLRTVDLRDRAGWSDEAAQATPKMAALLADAALSRPPTPVQTIESAGVALVYGAADVALPAAERLADALGVTCMLTDPAADLADTPPPRASRTPLVRGRVTGASGGLGRFEVRIDGFAERRPGGRGGLQFETGQDGVRSNCDIIVDLSGDAPLFPAHGRRDGYLRADPRDPAAVARALFDAVALQGAFEKPLYVRLEESLCAHSRAQKQGCSRCLSMCPTGAISVPKPGKSDHVAIDPLACAGCGACAAVCPSGAVTYEDPGPAHQLARLRTMIEAYRAAGGSAPRLLIHDAAFGAELIALSARFGRGLPATVLPLEAVETAPLAHPLMLAALALGFADVVVLAGPQSERAALAAQVALANALAVGAGRGARIRLIEPSEPDALETALYDVPPPAIDWSPTLPLGEGRALTRTAMKALAGPTPPEPASLAGLTDAGGAPLEGLPQGAPYGAVLVNTDACTLCLACVSLCPSGALGDDDDKPAVKFQEDACLQCGVCANVCPETAITLEPRYRFDDGALRFETLHEEEPFECVSCGRPFGVKSTIERIAAKLRENHWMYTNSDNAQLIEMCDDCRVRAQYHAGSAPFQLGAQPKPRTTADYMEPSKADKDDA